VTAGVAQVFQGQLHGPGQPDAGTPAQGKFVGGRLLVDGGHDVDAARITVDAGGFNHEDVVLNWSDATGHFALMVTAAQAKQSLLATAPAALAPSLKGWNRGVSFTRNFWRATIAVASIAAIALTLGLWQHEAVVKWVAHSMSAEKERQLGQGMINGIRRQGHLVEQGKALDAIREIGGQLTRDSTRKYEWFLVDDASVNAFAIPGGFIVVNAGLVHEAETADELAGVLAHEIQHVEQRHSLQILLYQLGWATLLATVLGDPSTIMALMLLEVGNLSFSRELEAQADAGGLETLRKAGMSPDGMASFFRKLAADGDGAPAWLSTHPSTDERVAALEAELKANPCTDCKSVDMDWAEVHESLYADNLVRRPAPKP
jgi:beta-barrel assembly-enhancing protease